MTSFQEAPDKAMEDDKAMEERSSSVSVHSLTRFDKVFCNFQHTRHSAI